MGIVIDSNTLASVFNKKASDHSDFKPVLNWIVKGKAKIIIGGSAYINELKRTPSYLRFIAELNKVGKVFYQNIDSVDREVPIFRNKIRCRQFNDPHIFALISTSQCKILCSNDGDSFYYIHDRRISHLFKIKPKVYTNVKHKPNISLLSNNNLTKTCEPHFQLSKDQIRSLSFY